MVVQHQQDARGRQNEERSETERAQEPCRLEGQGFAANLDRGEVQEDVLLNREGTVEFGRSGAAPEHRTPDTRTLQIAEISFQCLRHLKSSNTASAEWLWNGRPSNHLHR